MDEVLNLQMIMPVVIFPNLCWREVVQYAQTIDPGQSIAPQQQKFLVELVDRSGFNKLAERKTEKSNEFIKLY